MTFTCFHCGFTFPAADNYKRHLIAAHPETALAKRSAKELERPEICKLDNQFAAKERRSEASGERSGAARTAVGRRRRAR